MKLKKSVIFIVIAILIILAIVVGVMIYSKNINTENSENSLTAKLQEKITQTKELTYTITVDDNNQIIIILKGDQAYKEVTSGGRTKRYIVKNGDTYYLDDDENKYYKYQSNDEILTEIREQFENINIDSLQIGKETIDGRRYKYEEISRFQDFLFNSELSVNNLEYAKTRLYYKDEVLCYVKTIVGENEELIKIDISFENVDSSYFKIPSDYTEV